MKQFMLAVHSVEGAAPPPPDVMRKMYADVAAFNETVQKAGQWVFGGGLQPPARAKVVRSESGKAIVRDGPFAEAKELIGGFWVLKAPDLATALELARKASIACGAPVEVREFQEPAAD